MLRLFFREFRTCGGIGCGKKILAFLFCNFSSGGLHLTSVNCYWSVDGRAARAPQKGAADERGFEPGWDAPRDAMTCGR